MIRILLIDDDASVFSTHAPYLKEQGCTVDEAYTASEALQYISWQNYEAVLLDVMMQEKGGFDLIGELMQLTDAPIIFFSNFGDMDFQIKGFTLGAADYITKDCPLQLFWVKVKTRIEMWQNSAANLLSYPPLQLNLQKHCATVNNQDLLLTATEFQILALMASKPRVIWSVEALYRKIWGEHGLADVQLVQTHMSRMRRKLEKSYPLHDFLVTVWGKGYQFVPKEEGDI